MVFKCCLSKIFLFLILPNFLVFYQAQAAEQPVISIIIDDMGVHADEGQKVIGLPKEVTLAFLPYGAHTKELAISAHQSGHDVILHLPMATINNTRLDRGALTKEMSKEAFEKTLKEDLLRIPHAIGVNNHMGSALTQTELSMTWLMSQLQTIGGLFFVDSRTTVLSVAEEIARKHGVPARRRDVFLDNVRDKQKIEKQFQVLVKMAKKHGSAVAIGHPYQETTDVLAEQLIKLSDYGVKLVAVKQLVTTNKELANEESLGAIGAGM
jgi:uncharacterized protein